MLALFAAGLATFALLYSVQPLLPELARTFHVSAGQSALSISACTVGLGIALLFAGPLSEVLGRTRLIVVSLIASCVIAALCAVAPSWPALLALRTVQGIALAGVPSACVAYLREEISDEAHGKATGLYVGGTAIGGMLGRLLASAVAELGGWRYAVAADAVLGLLCAIAVVLLLPASRNFRPAPASPRHLLRLTTQLLRDPALLGLYALAATMMGAFVAVYNAMAFRLAAAPYLLGLGTAGLVFCVYPIGSVSSSLAGRWADRVGRRAVVPVACFVALAGVLLTLPSPLALVVVGLAVLTGGFFAAHGVASGWVAARAHAGPGGTAQAASLYLFGYYLGSSVFGALAGTAWTSHGWGGVVVLSSALIGVGLLISVALRRTAPIAPAAHTQPDAPARTYHRHGDRR